MKRVIIIGLIAVALFFVVRYFWKRSQNTAAKAQAPANQMTTGAGLIGWIKGLVDKNDNPASTTQITEAEAKEISKQIADLLETENSDNIAQANALVASLEEQGWKYVSYNNVSQLV